MNVKNMKVADLVPYENNPRKNEGAVDAVAASIKEFGFRVPIVIDKENVIVAGHTRLKAAEKLGVDEVPVVIADDLTDEQIKAYRLADNKTAELAGWDFEKLDVELFDIENINMEQFGFTDVNIPEFLDAEETEDHKVCVKLTFADFDSFEPNERELKEIAERMGAEYGLSKI